MKPYIQQTLSDDKGTVESAQRIPPKSEGGGGGLTDAVKQALLECFADVAWADDQGQTHYDNLQAALYPLDHITAVYTQSGTVYDTDSLDSLKTDLVVTAYYDGGNTETVAAANYTLSGTLTAGTSTITVAYAGKTATFTVTVTESKIWLYHFNDSLASSGTKDFGLSATTPSYITGKFSKALSVASGTPANAPISIGIASANLPTFAGDFTIACWVKTYNDANAHTIFRLCKNVSSDRITNSAWANITNYNSHTKNATQDEAVKSYVGLSGSLIAYGKPFICFYTDENTAYAFSFSSDNVNKITGTNWHHVAVCRKNGVVTLYVDGLKWQSFPMSGALYVPDQILFCASWDSTNTAAGITAPQNANVDEFYINDGVALYDDEFTPPASPY